MTRLVAMCVALLAIPGAARAGGDAADGTETTDDEPGVETGNQPAGGARARAGVGKPRARMTLPGGKFLLAAVVEANMAKDVVGKPISFGPDLWFGLHDRLTLGVVHSGRAATGFLTGFGTGFCFRGEGSCVADQVYTFAGGEARIGLTEGGFALAFAAGVHVRQFESGVGLTGKAGFLARLHGNRIALELAPMVYIGMTQRTSNLDELGAPVTVFLRLTGSFALAIQGGITFVIKDAGQTWQVPAAAGIAWWVTPHFSIDLAFGLAAVADSDDATRPFDRRSATVGLAYAP